MRGAYFHAMNTTNTTPTTPEFAYGMRSRPFSIGAQPKGATRIDEADKRARWGVVFYACALTPEEVASFELVDFNREFLFVADGTNPPVQTWVPADDEKQAHKAFWESLTLDQQNATESCECIEIRRRQIITPERADFLASIIVTAVEGGIQYWSEHRDYKWKETPADDLLVSASVEIRADEDNREELPEWTRITPDSIEKALTMFRDPNVNQNLGTHSTNVKTIVGADATNDAGDIDSDLADQIVQVAAMGKVIFG